MIETKHLDGGYGSHTVLRDISLSFPPGQVTVLLGPNGCGKSTLVKTVLGLQPRQGGDILFDGESIDCLTVRQIAQKAAYLAQSRNIPSITARRMVLHGRFPYLSYPRHYRPEDRAAAQQALEWAGAADLADRPMPELSGGQRQKVYLAMALAQDTESIFMDEPTTYLDVERQMEVMRLARRMAAGGRAVAAVLHDLCLALRTADRIGVMAGGSLAALGTPEEIFTSGVLEQVFGVAIGRLKTARGWQYYYDQSPEETGETTGGAK